MYNIKNSGDLSEAILLLENELIEQKQNVAAQIETIVDRYRPVNVVRDIFKEVRTSEEFRSNILTAVMGISTGYLAKKLFFSKRNNILRALAGNFLQYGLANLIINPGRLLRSLFQPMVGISDSKKNKQE